MFANKEFSFVGHFKLFLIVSAILVVTGVVGLVTLPFGLNLFNMDVDFLGGVTMTYDLGQQVDTGAVEDLASGILERKLSSVTTSGSTGTQVVIKSLFVDVDVRNQLTDAIQETYPDAAVVSSSSVSASVRRASPLSGKETSSGSGAVVASSGSTSSSDTRRSFVISDSVRISSSFEKSNSIFLASASRHSLKYSSTVLSVILERVATAFPGFVGSMPKYGRSRESTVRRCEPRAELLPLTKGYPVILQFPFLQTNFLLAVPYSLSVLLFGL